MNKTNEELRALLENLSDEYIKTHGRTLPGFWDRARCTNTLKIDSPGAKKYRLKYGPFRRIRRYIDPITKEVRRTIEKEVGEI